MSENTKYTTFRCPLDLLAKVNIRRKQENRSLSNYIIHLLAKDTEGVALPSIDGDGSEPGNHELKPSKVKKSVKAKKV